MNRHHTNVDHSRIANLAYAYWQERGRPLGSPEVDWLKAEARIGGPVRNELPLLSVRFEPNQDAWL
jgi:Protein of unknown function (DUF2934)